MNLAEIFLNTAESNYDRPALVLVKTDGIKIIRRWNYLKKEAIKTAVYLQKLGIKDGDFVAIVPLNLPESFIAMWGIILAGAVPVPINPSLVREEGLVDMKKILDDCRPVLILANKHLSLYLSEINHKTVEETLAEASRMQFFNQPPVSSRAGSDDLVIMPYTSGTSANPKGVMLTHKNIFDRVEAVNLEFLVSNEERVLSYLPLGHIGELICTFFGQIYQGYAVFFSEYAGNTVNLMKNFQSVLKCVQPTIFLAVPQIWSNLRKQIEKGLRESAIPIYKAPRFFKGRLIKNRLGLNKTRVFVSAASKLNPDDYNFFSNSFGIQITDIYGLTETAGPLTVNGKTLGKNIETFLDNEEILVSGDCVMSGYFKKPEINSIIFEVNGMDKKVLHTGDAGRIESGKIICEGRVDDEFKLANGEKINTAKRESAEKNIREVDARINEVIICGANKPYLIALVFSEYYQDQDLYEKIRSMLPQVGEGNYAVRKAMLVSDKELLLTPTLKIKRKLVLKNLKTIIDSAF